MRLRMSSVKGLLLLCVKRGSSLEKETTLFRVLGSAVYMRAVPAADGDFHERLLCVGTGDGPRELRDAPGEYLAFEQATRTAADAARHAKRTDLFMTSPFP